MISSAFERDRCTDALNEEAPATALPLPERPYQDSRPKLNTFDVFDTLITRRCIAPARIFDLIAAQSRIGNFAAARVLAEARVAGAPYDLDTIYTSLQTILNLDAETMARLKALEIAFEHENAIPVAENMARVADGDVLISDMYLGADVIRSLLRKAGFEKKVALIVTCDGKQSGRIWPRVLDKIQIKEHLGDNAYSDNIMPARFGIPTQHTKVTDPNTVEKTLIEIGLPDLASLCREARLASYSERGDIHALQSIQASFNFPILVLASLALARLAQHQSFRSLLFCSRDCNLWLPLFRVMAAQLHLECPASYFYTSRLTRTKPSMDYLAYAQASITDGAALVDICGTGWSLAHLFQNLGLNDQHLVLLHRLPPVRLYEELAATPATCTVHALLPTADETCDHVALEMSNYAEHGMVADMCRIGETNVPIFSPDQRPRQLREAIEAQRHCFMRAVTIISEQGLKETLALDDASISVLCKALYQGLSKQTALQAAYQAQHHAEDMTTLRQLGCI